MAKYCPCCRGRLKPMSARGVRRKILAALNRPGPCKSKELEERVNKMVRGIYFYPGQINKEASAMVDEGLLTYDSVYFGYQLIK